VNTAEEITNYLMDKKVDKKTVTPRDLKVKFNLNLDKAREICDLTWRDFGFTGEGYDWYVKKIEEILNSRKFRRGAVAQELVKVAKLLIAGPVVPVEIGDTILIGKFKNRKAIVKGFGSGKLNQPVVLTDKGEIPLFKFRIPKLIKE
jgi:hypothetical protein